MRMHCALTTLFRWRERHPSCRKCRINNPWRFFERPVMRPNLTHGVISIAKTDQLNWNGCGSSLTWQFMVHISWGLWDVESRYCSYGDVGWLIFSPRDSSQCVRCTLPTHDELFLSCLSSQ